MSHRLTWYVKDASPEPRKGILRLIEEILYNAAIEAAKDYVKLVNDRHRLKSGSWGHKLSPFLEGDSYERFRTTVNALFGLLVRHFVENQEFLNRWSEDIFRKHGRITFEDAIASTCLRDLIVLLACKSTRLGRDGGWLWGELLLPSLRKIVNEECAWRYRWVDARDVLQTIGADAGYYDSAPAEFAYTGVDPIKHHFRKFIRKIANSQRPRLKTRPLFDEDGAAKPFLHEGDNDLNEGDNDSQTLPLHLNVKQIRRNIKAAFEKTNEGDNDSQMPPLHLDVKQIRRNIKAVFGPTVDAPGPNDIIKFVNLSPETIDLIRHHSAIIVCDGVWFADDRLGRLQAYRKMMRGCPALFVRHSNGTILGARLRCCPAPGDLFFKDITGAGASFCQAIARLGDDMLITYAYDALVHGFKYKEIATINDVKAPAVSNGVLRAFTRLAQTETAHIDGFDAALGRLIDTIQALPKAKLTIDMWPEQRSGSNAK
jgi:hypothetical protein